MRNLTRRACLLGLFVMSTASIAIGCSDTGPDTSSKGAGGTGGSAGSATGGEAGSPTGGMGGSAGQGTGGGGQGGAGGQGGGNAVCNPGDTMPCYSGDPLLIGIGECKGGTFACVNGQWDTKCAGEVLPSGAADVCDGKDEDCNGQVDDGFGQATCGMGVCQVTVSECNNGVPQTCTPAAPAAPKCDGFDEDCDGQIDEPDEGCSCTDGAQQDCYSGGAGTSGVGVCKKGKQTCVNGSWGTCVGEVLPGTETCNALDDDCNGLKDDGLGQTTCGSGQCSKTVDNCVNGVAQTCVPGTAMLELCNGVDDNCNGLIDDGLGTISCGVGSCRATVQACSNGMPGNCVPGMPTAELCDDADNDCDGVTDNGNPGGGGTCTTPLPGICSVGTQQCSFGTLVCAVTVQPGSVSETCNNLDDNCNGVTDEGNPGGGQSCDTGVPGVCQTGTSTCNNGGIICTQTVFPSVEGCDGLDNNCNGLTDENNAGGGGTCTVAGQQGACAQGAYSCTNGTLVCTQTVTPTAETCDNKDNDCDGFIDEGNPGGDQNCTATGATGECRNGKTTCSAGSYTCTPGTPTAEVCDGKDNDCNGAIDNGNPGGGNSCTTTLPGICNAGTTACSNGAIVCNANQMPTFESCNGLDDNCNGAADENNPGSSQACTAPGQQGDCAMGTTTCNAGTLVCLPGPNTPEACDGRDNDCDGTVDDGNPGGGQFCIRTDVFGECAKGTTSCSGGTLNCVAGTPTTETCDGKDNDCDGLIDENNPGGGGACSTGLQGICNAGTVTCVNGALSCIQNQMAAPAEICGNTLDDNCNGTADENTDADGDGWGVCNGDCCDNPSQCSQPALVNPGAFEVVGNAMDDDCDAASSDTVAAPACSTTPLQLPSTALKLVQAMDLCQTTTLNPPLPTRKWGVITSQLTSANGTAPAPNDVQAGVLANFGTNVLPRKGPTMAALSSGTARDTNDPGYVQPETGWENGSTGTPPAVYLAAHGGTMQTTPGCTTDNDANDSANLKVQIRVPTNARSFTYKFKFYSTEFPEWICTQYNDFYLALITTTGLPIGTGPGQLPPDRNISFDTLNNPVSVNNGFFDVCQFNPSYPTFTCPAGTTELVGTGVGGSGTTLNDGGGTVWLTTTSPVVPGENMTIEFMIWDTGDHAWDSTVLLDAFEWSINTGTVGTTN